MDVAEGRVNDSVAGLWRPGKEVTRMLTGFSVIVNSGEQIFKRVKASRQI